MTVAEQIVKEFAPTDNGIKYRSVMKVASANHWMNEASKRAMPKKLFGSLWHSGELSVLFADTGVGKTMLAVQIADGVSSGKSIEPFTNEAEAQKILYIDFELTDKQFQMRYTNRETGKMHLFNDNFLRAEINSDEEISDEIIMASIEDEVIKTGAKVIVIDNITYLKNETEKGRNALPLMKHLNQLKKKHGLSILVLAHTPKRDGTRPIHLTDLYGSVMIANFIDGAFAIGRSSDGANFRYLKQLKCRSDEVEFHSENVAFIELIKSDSMIQFTFNDFTTEEIHLKQVTNNEKNELIDRIHSLADKGMTQREIAKEIDRSIGYVNKHLKQ
jgi:RecA-family ATPase/Trp operon repressor